MADTNPTGISVRPEPLTLWSISSVKAVLEKNAAIQAFADTEPKADNNTRKAARKIVV